MCSGSQEENLPSRQRARTKGSVYRGATTTSYGSNLEGGVETREDMELGAGSDSRKNLCSQESVGCSQDDNNSLSISRSRSKSLEIARTVSFSITNTGS